jgi:hypothetical protein
MNLTKKISVIALLGLLMIATACSFNVSTANIGGLKLGKDKEVQQETKTFAANETIYSAVTISSNPGTVTVKGKLHVVEIEGQKAGPIPGAETTVTVAGEGTANFNFTQPNKGWPQGKYKFEALMLNEDGEQKDSKSQDFTVN